MGPGGLTNWKGSNSARKNIDIKLGLLGNLLLGCLMINADNVIPLIQRTNNRIYKAFQDLDDKLQSTYYADSDFAGKYRVFMDDKAATFNVSISGVLLVSRVFGTCPKGFSPSQEKTPSNEVTAHL